MSNLTQIRIMFWGNCFLFFALTFAVWQVFIFQGEVNILSSAVEQSTRQDLVNVRTFYDDRRSRDALYWEVLGDVSHDVTLNSQRVLLVEESLDPQNTRWAKIKMVRSVVKAAIEEKKYKQHMKTTEITIYASAVVDYSEKYDVPISLIVAITTAESAFFPGAMSSAGARGLTQVMPTTAKDIAADLGVRHYNMYKIRDNVRFGVYYIMKMLDEFQGDAKLALMAYNAGPTYVHKVLAGEYKEYPAETQDYVGKILGDETREGFVTYYKKAGL